MSMAKKFINAFQRGTLMWNKLCKLVEKNKIEAMYPIMEQAKLFVFDKPAHEFLPRELSSEMVTVIENFRLPFNCIAIEDPGSLIIISEFSDIEAKEGLNQPRIFVEFMTSGAEKSAFDTRVDEQMVEQGIRSARRASTPLPAGASILLVGTLHDIQWSTKGFKSSSTLLEFFSFQEDFMARYLSGEALVQFQKETGQIVPNWRCALQEIVYFMRPKNFILETTPKKVRKPGKKFIRQHERPIYTVLEPGAIRKTMGLSVPAPDGKWRASHERRGHNRILRHERFGENRGKTIWINPTWIGPSEAVAGNKKYKVRLDI